MYCNMIIFNFSISKPSAKIFSLFSIIISDKISVEGIIIGASKSCLGVLCSLWFYKIFQIISVHGMHVDQLSKGLYQFQELNSNQHIDPKFCI